MPKTAARALVGSRVVHHPRARRIATLHGDRRLEVTVVLHPVDDAAHAIRAAHPDLRHPAARPALSRDAFARHYDPGDEAIERIEAFAHGHGLAIHEVSRARHDVVLEGTAEGLERAFGVSLHEFEHAGGRYHAHTEAIRLPRELAGFVDGVLGLDSVPLHRPRAIVGAARGGLTVEELPGHYRFPAHGATGETIALLEFGGGYDTADLEAFASRSSLALPLVRAIGIQASDGTSAQNSPLERSRMAAIAKAWGEATSFLDVLMAAGTDLQAFIASMEVTMDIELGIALGGGASIDVYFAPQGADGWRRAIYAAIGEPYGGTPASPGTPPGTPPAKPHLTPTTKPPAALSISWGASERSFGAMKMRVIHKALNAAELRGIAVCCASGDHGSSNAFGKTTSANVNFPASSPAVLAVGGTEVVTMDSGTTDVAWKGEMLGAPVATGGGMSGFFDQPAWQHGPSFRAASGTWLARGRAKSGVGRWLPDVAANAAFESGVQIVVGGADLVSGGTSAAAPLWAALLTRIGSALGHHVGGLNAWLYGHADRGACVDVIIGDNDVSGGTIAFYRAGTGWDACTGLGRPDGERLLQALRETAPISDSGTAGSASGTTRTRRSRG